MSDRLLSRIADLVAELVDPILRSMTMSEWVKGQRVVSRRTKNYPSLLDQVREIMYGEATPSSEGGGKRPPPGSSLPINLPAMQLLLDVGDGVDDWQVMYQVERRGGDRPLENNIRSLVGLAGQLDADNLESLASMVGGWHRRAEILTGWRLRSERPDAPCPECDEPTTRTTGLLVGIDTYRAVCLSCGLKWQDPADYRQLLKYVAAATGRALPLEETA